MIAGPIVHHKQILPQFERERRSIIDWDDLAIGLSIFMLGLFKKVVLADGIAPFADSVFRAAETGAVLTFAESWAAALSYTFQIYFDFSGYSDKAIGLSRMFGINLPLNFFSPYKANNIIEFWRRWHITLSQFLRDYLYIALGGNRRGPSRRFVNLLITMLLGGLWHGAGWTFVAWGLLHGFYLIINHLWHGARRALGQDLSKTTRWGVALSRFTTFLAVVLSWVFFRAETFDGAMAVLRGMSGQNGITLPTVLRESLEPFTMFVQGLGVEVRFLSLFPSISMPAIVVIGWIVGLFVLALWAPNLREMFARQMTQPVPTEEQIGGGYLTMLLQWQRSALWMVSMIIISVMALRAVSPKNAFLYFQF